MANKFEGKLDIGTSESVKGLKDVAKEARNLQGDMDETKSKGKALADALVNAADEAAAGWKELKGDSAALADALGADFVQMKADAGVTVDSIVMGLRELGLTSDEIRADVDQLADAIKHMDDTGRQLDGVSSGAKNLKGDLDGVRDSADQSRSVMANMVGNSVQDMSALGGVAGTAGMALGQFGEYAAEGNISLSGLAKVAGPMAALTAGTMALTWAIGAMGKEAKEAKRETELWGKVNEQIAGANYHEAAELMAEEWADTIPILKDLGYTEKDLIDTLNGHGNMLDDLQAKQEANNQVIADANGVWTEAASAAQRENQELDAVIENLEEGQTARVKSIQVAENHKNVTDNLARALAEEKQAQDQVGRSAKDLGTDLADLDKRQSAVEGSARAAEQATKDLDAAYSDLTNEIDDEQAWLDLQDNIDDLNTKMLDSTATDREKRQAVLDNKDAMIEYLGQLENVPAEKQTEILALISDEDWNAANAALAELTKPRTVQVKVGQIGYMKQATGGTTPGTGPVLKGENGPEMTFGNRGEYVATAAQTMGLQMAGSPAPSVVNQYNTTYAARITKAEARKLIRDWERENGRAANS